ncbi:MAG: glutathione synthase [Bacteroidota bacterium]
MIFLCGIPSELSLAMVIEEVRKLGVRMVVFNQRQFQKMGIGLKIDGQGVGGWMQLEGQHYRLEDFTGIYTRLTGYRALPELETAPDDSPALQYALSLQDTMNRWFEIAPGRVLSRNSEIGSNFSKPYQAQMILRQGFQTPETLVTNRPELVHQFYQKHGRIIYKSISCTRSIVKMLKDEDLVRLESICWCPVQFQAYIDGFNLRVHTVGDEAFATAIRTTAVDYRYAYLKGEKEQLEAVEISDSLKAKCIALSRSLGLEFAGVDLKITPRDEVYCLEVNPCPAFSYYQHYSGQPIAQAVAKLLVGATS